MGEPVNTRMLYWIEQDNPDNPDSYKICTISEADAIEKQRKFVSHFRPDFQYKDDQQALDDFIAVNWATYTPIIG
jgi:hypothetical protein